MQQRILLAVQENQTVLHLAKDCSSSVACMNDITEHDDNSLYSESTTALSTAFDFDASLMSSKAYQTAQRSYLRQLINSQRQRKHPGEANVKAIKALEEAKAEGNETVNGSIADNLVLQTPLPSTPKSEWNINSGQSTAGMMNLLGLKPPRPNAASLSQKIPSKNTLSHVGKRNGISITQSNIFRRLKIERKTDIKVEYDITPLVERGSVSEPVRRSNQIPKILLLGTSGSGKSTLLKAMMMSQENFRYEQIDMHLFRETILCNIQEGMFDMLKAMARLKIPLDHYANLEYEVTTIFRATVFSKEVRDAIEVLRVNPGLRAVYKRRREYQLEDNIMEYFDDIQRIGDINYVPTTEDILRSRVRTTGIHKYDLRSEAMPYRVLDVGGERSERQKWSRCYDDVDVVIFTIDAIALDKLLFEDETTNRMQEQLVLFDSIVNSSWFKTTRFIVVFTRLDRLEDCLKDCDVQEYLPDCPADADGNTSLIAYTKYLECQFLHFVPEEKRACTEIMWSNLTDPSHSFIEEVLQLIRKSSSTYLCQSSTPQRGATLSTPELAVVEEMLEKAR